MAKRSVSTDRDSLSPGHGGELGAMGVNRRSLRRPHAQGVHKRSARHSSKTVDKTRARPHGMLFSYGLPDIHLRLLSNTEATMRCELKPPKCLEVQPSDRPPCVSPQTRGGLLCS